MEILQIEVVIYFLKDYKLKLCSTFWILKNEVCVESFSKIDFMDDTLSHVLVRLDNKKFKWDYRGLSYNPSITYNHVAPGLVTMVDETRIGKMRLVLTRLKRGWRTCNTDPSYSVSQRRMIRDLGELKPF